ncbi:MAG: GAF domain-containing sensor histidine kinase [Phycisphaeraceae bacterium]
MTRQLDTQWLAAQNRMLEQLSAGDPLPAVLASLTHGAEAQAEGVRCLAMLADDRGECLYPAAAPSLPAALELFADGLPIGERESPCTAAAHGREPVVCEDTHHGKRWASFRPLADRLGIRACWSSPILGSDGRVLGTFAMLYVQPRRPGDRERQIIATCTRLAALAIERRRIEQQLHARACQQEVVAQLGHRALAGEDVQALMDEAVRCVARTLHVPLVKVLEREADGRRLRLRAGVGWQSGLVGQATVDAGLDSQAGFTLHSAAPVIVKNLPQETRFHGPPLLRDHGVISGLSVIIASQPGRPWGVLGAHSTERRTFTDDDIHFLQAIAHLLAAAIQRKAAERQLRALNETLEQRVAERTVVAEDRAGQLRALAVELTQTESRERRRLAQMLHDHLQQRLVAAKLRTGLLASKAQDTELNDAARQADQLLSEAITASRSLTVELSPPILYDAGLSAAMEWLARGMQAKHGLQVDVQSGLNHPPAVLSPDMEVFVFNAVRELLLNVARHAGVKKACVQLIGEKPGVMRVVVADEGVGFDPASLRSRSVTGSGFGLFSLQQRVGLLDGRIDITSQPGKGTRITIDVPATSLTSPPSRLASAPSHESFA